MNIADSLFPETDSAWQKNQLEQIEEIKWSGRMLELALDGQCDSPGHNAPYNTVSAIDTATNKLINFRVVHVKIWNYLNETTHFCILHTQSQCHNIKATLKPRGNFDIRQKLLQGENYRIFLICFFPFWQKFLPQV